MNINEQLKETERRRGKLYAKARKFGYSMQKCKWGTPQIVGTALYFQHKDYDETCISADMESLEDFIRVAERNYKLEKLGL